MLEEARVDRDERTLHHQAREVADPHRLERPVLAGPESLAEPHPEAHEDTYQDDPLPAEVPVAINEERQEDRCAPRPDLRLTVEDHRVALLDVQRGRLVGPDE